MEPYRLTPGHLRRIPSLNLLSEDQLAAFLNYVDVVSCKAGAKLFLESQAGDALYMILEGEMRVLVQQRGRQIAPMRTLEANDTFGEVALLSHTPRAASVEAVTECTLVRLSSTMLDKLMAEQPAAASSFLYYMARTLGCQLAEVTTKLRNFQKQVDLLSAL
jgi:CRP-like cAMP-binding protein